MSAKSWSSDIHEYLQGKGVGFKFTTAELHAALPHVSEGLMSVYLVKLRKVEAALGIAGTTKGKRNATCMVYVVTENIKKVNSRWAAGAQGVKLGEREERDAVTFKPGEAITTHPRKQTAQEIINEILGIMEASQSEIHQLTDRIETVQKETSEQMLAKINELERLTNEATRLELVPSSKLRGELDRRRAEAAKGLKEAGRFRFAGVT